VINAFALSVLLAQVVLPQGSPPGNHPLDPQTRAMVIDGISKALIENYVSPELGKRMASFLRTRQQKYDAATDAIPFAEELTSDLQEISHDKHIRVVYSARALPVEEGGISSADEQRRLHTIFIKSNFSFEEAKRLPGNIGYLDLREFAPEGPSAETAAAAMNFLANTDALIIDLRQNMGGDPAMVALLASYFFDDAPVHLNDLHWRARDRVQQWWTQASVAGKRYGSKKRLYILTSHQTFSAAEEFAYDLQALKRAAIVGESTGGGANPGENRRLSQHFSMFVPMGRAVNPITRTNWENTGVKPDVAASAETALKVAYLAALNEVVRTAEDERLKSAILRQIEGLRKELETTH